MIEPSRCPAREARYELRFAGVSSRGRGYSFPCDAAGRVDIDELTDRGRVNYFYARTVVGKELFAPVVFSIEEGAAGGTPMRVEAAPAGPALMTRQVRRVNGETPDGTHLI